MHHQFSKYVLVPAAAAPVETVERDLRNYDTKLHSMAQLKQDYTQALSSPNLSDEAKLKRFNIAHNRLLNIDKARRAAAAVAVVHRSAAVKAPTAAAPAPVDEDGDEEEEELGVARAEDDEFADAREDFKDTDEARFDPDLTRKQMVSKVAPSYREKARGFLTAALSDPHSLYVDRDRRVFVKGSVVPGASFDMYVDYMFKPRKIHTSEPTGFNHFWQFIKEKYPFATKYVLNKSLQTGKGRLHHHHHRSHHHQAKTHTKRRFHVLHLY